MNSQDVNLQIVALEQLKLELENFVKDLDMRSKSYYEHVKALANLDVNFAQNYDQQYWRQDYSMIQSLKQHLQNTDIKFVMQAIDGAKVALSKYKQ